MISPTAAKYSLCPKKKCLFEVNRSPTKKCPGIITSSYVHILPSPSSPLRSIGPTSFGGLNVGVAHWNKYFQSAGMPEGAIIKSLVTRAF